MTTPERRNDLGSKIKDGIIILMFGAFMVTAWGVANAGNEKATALGIKVVGIEECLSNIKEDLKEIKELLKRSTPFERTK